MNISYLIEELIELKKIHGDIDVRRYDSDEGDEFSIDYLHYEKNHTIYGDDEYILLV